jgi:RHS repeat-associated protein
MTRAIGRCAFRSAVAVLAFAFSLATPRVAAAQDPCELDDPPPPPECFGAPSVDPDGGTAGPRTAHTGGHTAVFTVSNVGFAATSFQMSCAGSGGVTCTGISPGSVLNPGASETITVSYSVGAPGTGTLSLTASTSNGAWDDGWFSIQIVSYGVTVVPDGGTAPTRTANTGGYSESFTVTNTGSASNTYSFSCSGVNGVTCGTVPAPVTLAPAPGAGSQATVSMPYSVGTPGTGILTLTANGTNTSDPGSYSVPIVSYGVTVVPDFGRAPTRTANTGGYSESFTVTNTGSASNTYSFSCSGVNGVTCGTVPTPVTLAPAPGAGSQATVSMPYSVGAPSGGTLTLTALGTNASDQGDFFIPIVSYGVTVVPDGGTAPTRTANTGGYSESFTVTNTGSASNTYSFSCSGVNGVTCGTVPAPVTLAPAPGAGSQVTVSMPYSVGAPGTGGTLTLTASGTNASDPGSYSVPIVSYGVTVVPDGGAAPTRTANTGGYSESFTVTNTGSASNTYSFSCSGVNGVTCGTVPAPVTLAPAPGAGSQATVSMPYSVGAPGAGTLTLTANGTNTSDPGSYSVPIVSYGVSVVPDGGTATTRTANTGGYSESFTVTNTGSASNTYSFSCSGVNGVTCGTVPTPVTLAPAPGAGSQATVSMPYSVGAPGTGTLTLTANGANTSDAGSYSVPIFGSAVSGGVFVKDGRYLLQETADSYDAWGRVTQLTDARGKVTTYGYGPDPTTRPFLTQVRRVSDPGGVDLVTDIAYSTKGFVESIRDEGGTFRYFSYDTFGRLSQIQNNSHTPVRAYGYTYSRSSPNWTFDPASPNAIVDTTFMRQAPVKAVVSTSYLDGLGRPIQTVAQDTTTYHVSATQYDLIGRTWRVWKPYTRGMAGFDAGFAANATAFYNTYHSTTTAKPYTETAYTADALARVKQVTPQYTGATPPGTVQHSYGVDLTLGPRLFTQVSDELGKKTRSYTDAFGQVVQSTLGFGTTDATVTQFVNNVLGQRTQATDPRGLVTTYTFDTRGLQTSRSSPDAGAVNSKYDQAANVRFTQDANQAAAGQVYFTNYDFAARPRTSGLGTATLSALNPDVTEAFEATQTNWLVARQYDAMPPAAFPWNLFPTPSPLPANLVGRLVAIASKSNGAWQVTYFSYDADGQVARRHIYTQGNGGTPPPAALHTAVVYTRDLRGALTQRALTVGTTSFTQWYQYDARGLLTKAFTTDPSQPGAQPDVVDAYRPSGLPQSYQFQGGPVVPIRYTIREQTERIGDPTGGTYPFSARYAYQPNGVVDTAEFWNGGLASGQRYRYVFGPSAYDALNRLKSADFWAWTGAWSVSSSYDLPTIGYDAAGNITALQRRNNSGVLIDNLIYNYLPGTNRLGSLTENAGITAETWDAEVGSFTYDANGNMTTAPEPYSVTAVTYDPANLPLAITRSGVTSNYRYDDAGQRITKQVGAGNTEVYLREGATVLGVFTMSGGTVASSYFNILWEDRVVGRHTSANVRSYYHFDHLGSVRAVVSNTGAVLESSDFDPWGLAMPGRALDGAAPVKERFSGKERDAETGLDYFGARYYMAAVGRWASFDPAADGTPQWSPYNYVLNNPLGFVDPDGRQAAPNLRCTNWTGPCARAAFAGIDRRLEPWRGPLTVAATVVTTLPTMGAGALAGLGGRATLVLELATTTADVVATSGPDLQQRADDIHDALPDQIARDMRTTAVGDVELPDGNVQRWTASSQERLPPPQRDALRPGEMERPTRGVGPHGHHAEMRLLDGAESKGGRLVRVATSPRPPCPTCEKTLLQKAVEIVKRIF